MKIKYSIIPFDPNINTVKVGDFIEYSGYYWEVSGVYHNEGIKRLRVWVTNPDGDRIEKEFGDLQDTIKINPKTLNLDKDGNIVQDAG